MIDYKEVIAIQKILINEYGGLEGIRDEKLLKSAIERPFAGLSNQEFYPSPEEKAASVLESMIRNHPFVDGNKRIGYVLMRLILMHYKRDINASQEEKFEFVIQVASSKLDYNQILNWIKTRIIDKE